MRSLAVIAGYVQGFRSRSLVVAMLVGVAVQAGGTTQARAGYVLSGQSSGASVSANLTVAGVGATASLNTLTGSSPLAYGTSQTIASGSVGIGSVFSTTTGSTTTTIGSNIGVGAGTGDASASTVVNNLGLNLLGGLLTIDASTLTTSTIAGGSYNSLTTIGTQTPAITGLGIYLDVLGTEINVTALINLGLVVNLATVLGQSDLTGVTLGLDVTTTTGDGITSEGVTSDNIVVGFNNVLFSSSVINGSIVIGQSNSIVQATAVPEPGSMALTVLGLAGIVTVHRNRKRQRLDRV